MNQPLTKLEAIESRIDTNKVSTTGLSNDAGGLAFQNVTEAMEFAKLMALSDIGVRKHLRGNPGACLGVVIQAVEWGMSPYSVANKSYLVNDQLAYESQLIQAVILRRAPIKGRIRFVYAGEGHLRTCTASATTLDGEEVKYTSPEIGKIPTKNSPLWKSDPDQQLSYFCGRSLCRRHFPDVLLGIYDREEAEEFKDVTPQGSGLAERLNGASGGFNVQAIESELQEATEADNAEADTSAPEPDETAPTPSPEPEQPKEAEGPDPDVVRDAQSACADGRERTPPDGLSDAQREHWFAAFDEMDAEMNAQ